MAWAVDVSEIQREQLENRKIGAIISTYTGAVIMSENITHVEKATWQNEVMSSPLPVLVDFWAEWCGPCRAIAPVLEELSQELKGKLKIVKVNVDEAPDLAGEFGIRSIPTLLVIKGGAVVSQMVGAMSKTALKSKLDAALGG